MDTTHAPDQQYLFVDAGITDLDILLANINPTTTVITLTADSPALTQIADAVAGQSDLTALHIISHGSSGTLDFSSGSITETDLLDPASAESLATIRASLSQDADILLYGCNVAEGDAGAAFISQLSSLTGADVAASDDLTGSSLLNGDWALEAATGSIEAVLPISATAQQDYQDTLTLPGAHSGTVSSQVFLGGNYIELGISNVGSFGTTVSAPSGFYGTASSTQVGMSNDADGYGNGTDLRIDYFLPGSPEERWAVGYNGSSYGGFSAKNGNSGTATTLTGTSVSNNTSGDTLSATFDTTVQSTLDVTQVHTFQVNDKYFKTTVTITNVSSGTLTDVRYMRSFDPDNTVYKSGSYTTVNKVENTYSTDGKSVVSATSQAGDTYNTLAGATAKILFFSSDPRANVANFGFSNSNPYAMPTQATGYTTTSDSGIAIMFKGGTLAAGASVTFEYFTSLDTADISTTVATIEAASNPAPTFTAFALPIDTTNEDTQVELTFAELAAQGNEADQMPDPALVGSLTFGTVNAFVVTSVKTGSLKIGANAASATAWNPGTNEVIDATHNAYWTPAANANNTENSNAALNAFDVKARDTDGLLSSTAVTAKVNVTAVNDAPVIASAATNVSLTAINEDQNTINGATVSALVGPRFTDVDAGSSMGGIIIVGDTSIAAQGIWQYSTDGTNWFAVGTVAANNGLALAATAKLRFVPTTDWNGTPGGLTVYVTDNLYIGGYTSGATRDTETSLTASGISSNTVNIVTTVNSVNDLPVFTSAAGAASLTETSGWDTSVTTASGALTGTLTGTDVEGAVTFNIRGGSEAGGTVTKAGFYGTLTLNTSTNAWTYTPGNWTAINALAAGGSATDSFEFKIIDSSGASTIQALTVTLTGTNDTPVLAHEISDQTYDGQGTWSYQIPADAFTDAEGLGLTYSTSALPAGISFDPVSRTFSGDPTTAGTTDITVTATDSAGATVSDVFQLSLTSVGNQGPIVANPVAPVVVAGTTEVTPVSFSTGASGETVIFAGTTVTLNKTTPAAEVASALLGSSYTNWNDTSVDADTLRFTAKTNGIRNDVTASDWAGTYGGGVTIAKVQDGTADVAGAHERFVLTLANNDAEARTLKFQGVTVNIAANATADAIANDLNGDIFASWTASRTAAGQVTFTHSADGDQTNIITADFTGTYMPLPASPTVVESSVSNFLLQAVATDSEARTFVLDGASMTIAANQTAAQVAALIAGHGAFGKWNTAVVEDSTKIRFTDTDVVVVPATTNTLISQTFDSNAAFTENFTGGISSGSGGAFSWGAAAGITAGGGITVPSGSDQLWTSKQSYTVTDNGVYKLSALFKIAENSGYGGLGFSVNASNDYYGGLGMPDASGYLGVSFHGGGGSFHSSGANGTFTQSLTWTDPSTDLTATPDTWYLFEFTVTAKGASSYDLKIDIYNADQSTGAKGTLFSEKTITYTNTSIGSAESLHVFFSAEGNRMSAIDNFVIDLQNSTAVGTQTGQTTTAPVISGTYVSIAGTPTAGSPTDGTDTVAGQAEIFDATVGDGTAGTTLTFDSTEVTVPPTTLTAAEVAAQVAGGSYTGYTDVDNGNGTVTLTATTPGVQADIVNGNFTGTYSAATVGSITQGANWSYQVPVSTFSDPEGNPLTYTAELDGVVFDDTAALTFDEATLTFSGNGSALPAGALTVTAHDAVSGLSASAPVTLSIGNASDGGVSVGTGITGPTWNGAGEHSFQVPANAFVYSEGDTNGNGLTYSATLSDNSALPAWLSINAATGEFSGNPVQNAPGTLNIKVTATDTNGNVSTANQIFTLTITNPNDAPLVAANLPDVTIAAGAAVSLDIGDNLFSDPDGLANGTAATTDATSGIVYSAQVSDGFGGWAALPSWLSFNATTHEFSGNPPAGTPYLDIKVIGADAGGATAFTTFTMNFATSSLAASAANNVGAGLTISDGNGGSVALGDVLSASAPTDADGYTAAGNLTYQWQSKTSSGSWIDINGATVNTYTVTQAESSKDLRVLAFYTDNGGNAEAVESNTLSVPALNLAGTATVTGAPTPGETLVATLSDANGLTTAAPTYTWYRGDTSGAQTTEVGGNFSSYTLSNDDGGKYVTVKVTYTDDEGTAETAVDSTNTIIQLGIIAPVANNDTGIATEAGGVDNATGGSNATGNLFTNDTDANAGDTKALAALRSGNAEGLGTVGLLEGNDYVVSGDHGTLRVDKTTGAYTYTVNQWGWSVENLQAGQTLTDTFNYTVSDSTSLSDAAVLTVTINGANDAPTVRDRPVSVTVVEDIKTAIPFSTPFALEDIDSTGSFTITLTASQGKLTGATGGGVTVSGSESGTLTLTGALSDINAWLNAANTLYYTSAPNDNGATGATLTLTAADANGSGTVTLGTVTVAITAANDAPILDLNANNSVASGVVQADAVTAGADLSGNDHAVVFRPRGSAVNVVDSDSLISDIDGDTTLVGATAEITAGAWDNSFSIYETLSSTAGSSYVGVSGTITITGNGTGTSGLTGATRLTFSGVATHADYQSVLETIQYNNSLDSAFAGNRTITISVLDKASGDGGLASDAASFTVAEANSSIAVGQMIYINGVNSGQTVATVTDTTHFVASGPLSALVDGATLSFTLNGSAAVTTTTAKADLAATGYVAAAATTLVQVLWTPVVDLNGNATSGTDHTTSYTEGSSGSYIATPTALVTDQDGLLKTVTVILNNAADTVSGSSAETLFLSAGIVSNLTSNGITTTFYQADGITTGSNGNNGIHKIVFSGNKDATYFQLGLRGVQYKNISDNPSITARTVTTSVVDAADNTGVPATTTLTIVPVNDAPVIGGDYAGALDEGAVYTLTTTDLSSTDIDDTAGTLKYILTSVPDATTEGTLFRDSNNNNVVDSGEALIATADTSTVTNINAIASNGYFTQSEVAAGQIKYAHSGNNPNGTNATGTDSFGFKVVDGMEDYAFTNIATNQSGTVTLTVTEVNDAATGTPVVSGTMTPGSELTVATTGIADADGPGTLVFAYQWQTYNGTSWDNVGTNAATYTLQAADQGKQVRVNVSFDDALGRSNTLTDTATGTVAFTNTAGTGGVTITSDGSPQAGETLTATTSALTDDDGLGPVSYQWQVYDTGTSAWVNVASDGTSKTYTLPSDAATGAKYQVFVSYTDGRGNAESVTSGEKVVVAPATDATNDATNDAPLLTGDGSFGAMEATGTTSLFSGVAVSTIEAGQTITTLTLTVSGLQNGADEKLTVDGVALDLATTATTAITYAATPPAGTLGGVSYAITMAGSSPDVATVTLTRTGNLTEAEAKTLVEGLAFANTAATPTAGLRVVTLTELVDNGGTADSGHDTGTIGLSATVDVGSTLNPVAPAVSSNTAPAVSGDAATTVLEGGVITLASADLAATDTEQGTALKVVLASTPTNGTLFRDLNGNGLVDGTEAALTSGSKFALADIAAGRIKYLHNGLETTTAAFTFNVSDGLALSDAAGVGTDTDPTTFNITVTAVNDAPTLAVTAAGSSATPVAFTEGDTALALFSAANASTVDTGQNITELKVMVSGLRDGAAEILVVDGKSIALTHSNSGTTPATTDTPAGNAVGYAVSVTGGTATVTLTKADTATNWNGFITGLKYENTSQNPTSGNRNVTLIQLTDSGTSNNTYDLELTSVVAVTAVNDAPTLSTTGITVDEGGSVALTTTNAAALDNDNALTTLTYTLSTAPGQGSVYIDTNGNGVREDGEALAAAGTFTHAQLTAGQVRYAHDGSENGDTFALTVTDPGSATSAAQSIAVTRTATNDAPTITNLGSDVLTYPANSGAKTLEQGGDAVVSDPDSTNFGTTGTLRVSISFNRDPAHDVLSIQNEGTAAGQISVGAGTVSYANTQIGTFTGGTGTADLVVTFDEDATPAAVTALVKAIQFSNDQAAPALTSRTISFALNDGNSNGEAAPVAVNVNLLTGVTPSISIGNGFFVTENTTSVTTLSATDPNSRPITFSIDTTVDATNNPDSSKFEIVSGNLLRLKTAPDYETPDDTGSDRTYKVVVKATNDIGSSATQAVSVTVLNQVDESAAVGDTSGPAFGYATVSGTTLTMTYTDASNLDATNVPPASAFAVSGNTVTGVAVNATAKTVTLTLGTAVVAGATVTVAYTDPNVGTNDTAALQDAAGNDVATMAATAVTNLAAAPAASGGGGGTTTPTTPTTPATPPVTVTNLDGTTTTIPGSTDGTTTITAPASGGTISTTGTGNTTVSDPAGDLTVDNDGTGTVSVTGARNGGTISTTGTGITTVSDPAGDLTVDNDGTGTVSVTGVPDGGTITTTGTGSTSITNPTGTVTLNNTGSGTVNVSGITGDTTLNVTGSGSQHVDLTGMQAGDIVIIENTGSGTVDVSNLPDGVIVRILGDGPVVLNDNDGTSADVEGLVPALPNAGSGDGNGDGTPDALQSNVASVSFLETPTPVSNPADAPPVYVSLVADSREGVIDTTNALVASLDNIHQLDMPDNVPTDVQMPLGLISFESVINITGATETFSLFVDSSVNFNGYWKQDSEGIWCNIATAIVTVGDKTRIDFAITDGGEFDADGVANGVIVDPGAVGSMPLSLIGTTVAVTGNGFWF